MDFHAFHPPLRVPVVANGDRVVVELLVRGGAAVQHAWVRSEPDNEEFLAPLARSGERDGFDVWSGELKLNGAQPVTLYAFKLMVDGAQQWLTETGLHPFFPERKSHFRVNPAYRPARWVWEQVFYQIFPERFRNGDPSNDVRDGEYRYEGKPVVAKAWDELPDRAQGPREFYGGDLEGVRQALPYLEELGASALYLNPIFGSPSSHKYDTVDYDTVDPHFGTNETLAALCADLRQKGMRIVLDAVVNHTSERHPWFDRYAEHDPPGAYASADSPTRDFYWFHGESPDSYEGWAGVRTLPVLNFASAGVRERVFEADDAILRRWLRPPYSIDGWRFDVVHMLGEGPGARNNAHYVREFRRVIREENPEGYVLGEHFNEPSKWLQGDQEDGAMNYYGFGLPVRAFLTGTDYRRHAMRIDASHLALMLDRARARLPFDVQLSQFNLLDSHDTARFLTLLGGDRDLMRVAVTLLFTYVGVPCIYYGDEIGLEGGEDPDCRRTFPWDETKWDRTLLEHYRQLIRLRRSSAALREGAYVLLHAEGDAFAFARRHGGEVVVSAVNRGGADVEVELPVGRAGVKDGSGTVLVGEDGRGEGEVDVSEGVVRVRIRGKGALVLGWQPEGA